MENNNQHLRKRFEELAARAYNQGTYIFTDFLSLSDASVVCEVSRAGEYTLFGGADGCERVMARFGNPDELGYEVEFPITVIRIEPLIKKFSEQLNHRDFLGALMNLGIERDVIGDIMVRDNAAYVFAANRIADYITENFDRVKHTSVKCVLMSTNDVKESFTANLQEENILISSERLDAVISKVYNLSRNQTNEIFRERKVFVNGRLCENNSSGINPRDVVAVRGYGKFVYGGIAYVTKKGKISALVSRYI